MGHPAPPALAFDNPTTQSDSLLKERLPVASDKVPNQSLPGHITGNADDGGGGILPPDVVRIQSVAQVPVGRRQGLGPLENCSPRIQVWEPDASHTITTSCITQHPFDV